MTSELNAGFHPHYHQQGAIFKSSGAMSSSSSGSGGCEMLSMGNYYGNPGGNMNLAVNDGAVEGGMVFSSGGSPNSLSSSTLLLDSVPGLKHDTGLAVEWGIGEQYKLEEGLQKLLSNMYANEPNILMYIKIASSLRDKTVRDVALRCRWMMSKRRKHEDRILLKKVKDQRDKLIDSSLRNSMSPASSVNDASCSFISNHHNQNNLMFSEALSGIARHLLEENKQAFGQISSNLSALKLQENFNLFFHTRNNITTILNDMSNMPGIMSRMPPLPVLLNEELASSVFPCSAQPMMFGSSSMLHMKHEPRC
ncbi:uncharacterized protein LOC142524158 isoform X1 [Primulina tabacum]|uniref:uncharacterized protein LOC142524158 isoform X1 n=1 Tax=Primulina tabacum TaxID=48773 RepID=UPI003F593617